MSDFKDVWAEEKRELERRINLNETFIKDVMTEKHKGKLNKLIGISILGRNLALVYMVISIGFAFSVINEYEYSIPALFGALAMLLSFSQHLTLRKPDFIGMTTLELQKTIYKFRSHISKYAKYDIAIVLIWILTLTPIYIKKIFKIDIYSGSTHLLLIIISLVFSILLFIVFSRSTYQKWNIELLEIEEQMNQIKEFEEK